LASFLSLRSSAQNSWRSSTYRRSASEVIRARKREALLAATEAGLDTIAAAYARAWRPLRGQDKIAVRVDRVLRRRKVAKHFNLEITGVSHRLGVA
jgi:hypothetical protein